MFAGEFQELNEIGFILQHLCSDDDLTKLTYFINSQDPLREILPLDVNNYDLLMYNKLFPYLKIVDVDEEANVAINVYWHLSKQPTNSSLYKENFLMVDVLVHQDLWKIDSGIRTYQIISRIDKMLNRRSIPNITEPFNFVNMRALPSVNVRYAGFGLSYQKIDSGNMGDDI